MTDVEVFIDPGCPWAWITSRWIREVAPARDLCVFWRSYCLEIRDDYGVAPTVPEEYQAQALEGHAISHRMLRIFEAARAEAGEEAVDRLYAQWGQSYFVLKRQRTEELLADCVTAAGLDPRVAEAADDENWDAPIREAMEVASAFGGPKTQTPAIVVRTDPPHGFKGPVMAPAPTGPSALALWDAIQVLSEHQGFFEITRSARQHPSRPSVRLRVASTAVTGPRTGDHVASAVRSRNGRVRTGPPVQGGSRFRGVTRVGPNGRMRRGGVGVVAKSPPSQDRAEV